MNLDNEFRHLLINSDPFWNNFELFLKHITILTRGICPSSPASPREPQPLTRLQPSPFPLKSLPPKSSRKHDQSPSKVLLKMLSQSVQRDSQIPTEPKPASLPTLPKSGPLAQRTKNNSSNSNSYLTFPPKTAKTKDKGDLLFWFKVFPTSHFKVSQNLALTHSLTHSLNLYSDWLIHRHRPSLLQLKTPSEMDVAPWITHSLDFQHLHTGSQQIHLIFN